MSRIFALLFLLALTTACNKDGSSACSSTTATTTTLESEETGETSETSSSECTVKSTPPVTGETSGSTTSGASAGSGGGTTGKTTGGGGGSTTGGTTGTTTGGSSGSGLPTAAYTFDTNIQFVNTTADQQEKFDKAIEMIKKVVATEDFRSKILNHTYNGSKTFVDNGGFSNSQIYQKILDGAEKLSASKNNTMDMEVELYYAATSTVGYTYANTKRIYVNTKYFNTNSVASVAANLFHEWLHKVGFAHAVSYSVSRDYSVPYAIGRMISTLGPKL